MFGPLPGLTGPISYWLGRAASLASWEGQAACLDSLLVWPSATLSHHDPLPRAATIDPPDRLNPCLRLWLLGEWIALRGLPPLHPHPACPEPAGTWMTSHRWAILSWRWGARFPESASKWGTASEKLLPGLPLPSSLSGLSCCLQLGGGARKFVPTHAAAADRPSVLSLPSPC